MRELRRILCERVGLPLICSKSACRRGRRCAGAPSAATEGVQPCLAHYREEMRFLLHGPGMLLEQAQRKREAEGDPHTEANGPA